MKRFLITTLLLSFVIFAPINLPAAEFTGGGQVVGTINDYEVFPIGYCTNGASGPEALSTLSSTYKVNIRNFDASSDEDVYCVWETPPDFAGGTISFRVITWISNATGPSAEGVAFFLQGAGLADGELLSKAHGTAVKSSFAAETHSQYDRVSTDWSAGVTISGLSPGESAILKLYRDVSDSVDTYAQDIGVSMLQIKFSRRLIK